MTSERIHTQLLLENLVVPVEEDRVRPGRKPRVNGTVLSEEDHERIRKLIQERDRLPSGPKFRKQRLNIGCKIWKIRNPNWKPNPDKVQESRNRWLEKNGHRRKQILIDSYYRCRPPLKEKEFPPNQLASYLRKRRITDIQFSIIGRMRATLNRAFRRNWIRKSARTEELLGCTIDEVKSHIESQFINGMSWENRRSFVVDHIIPVVAFDLREEEESRLAFNWRNLQPLSPHDNAVKSDTIPSPLPDWLPTHIADRIRSRQRAPATAAPS